MIIAQIPLPKLRIPKPVRTFSRGSRIEISKEAVPFGATCWIGCRHAWPHVDVDWSGEMFLTLTIESGRDAYGEHELADLEYPGGELIRPGALAVIAPMTRHWLAPLEPHERPKPWLGVQWEVPEWRAPEQAQQIVRQLGGVWIDSDDRRYAAWRSDA